MRIPNYTAAFPQFNVTRAAAACSKQQEICAFVDETGRRCGEAFVTNADNSSVTLGFAVCGPYLRWQVGSCQLSLAKRPTAVHSAREFVLCPACSKPVRILYLVEGWRCRKCHGLHYLSQLRHPATKWRERLAALDDMGIRRGRPHGMHQRTYQRYVAERDRLAQRLSEARGPATSLRHMQTISSTWMAVADFGDELSHPDYRVDLSEVIRREPLADETAAAGAAPPPKVRMIEAILLPPEDGDQFCWPADE